MKKETPKPAVSQVDCLDGLRDCLETVRALGNLLEASGRHPQAEMLKPEVASRVGYLIVNEMEKAGQWLDGLDEGGAR